MQLARETYLDALNAAIFAGPLAGTCGVWETAVAARAAPAGVQPPRASWGNMLYQAQATLGTQPWLALAPGLFILMTALSVNLAGDRLASRRP